ncbi:MAG TPA: site-specific integrase, partial [Stellaceae bacterium]|nr:site-specific integrase [Stellaceae bacterium]
KVAKVEAIRSKTFQEFADEFITLRAATWKNPRHATQWPHTMRDYVYPVIGHLPPAEIKTQHIKEILLPIWTTKTETATRVRGRIEMILDAAKVDGLRDGDNPARWRGHLEHSLPKPYLVHQEEHHAAMPWEQIGAFMAELRARPALAARALEFCILTATRTENTIGATWAEIDLDKKLWTIPAARMKGTKTEAREHRVPLSDRVIEILRERQTEQGEPRPSDLIFPLSNMAMLTLLQKRMGRAVTVHGFRATFRSWVSARFRHSIELSKKALAHKSGDKVDDAYQREELVEERRPLMEAWAQACASAPTGGTSAGSAKVVSIAGRPARAAQN